MIDVDQARFDDRGGHGDHRRPPGKSAGGGDTGALHGSITGWLDALDWLDTFSARHIIPGHGPLATDLIPTVRNYLRWVLDSVDAVTPDFLALEAQARQRWPDWLDSERHAINLRLAHAEVHDHTKDIPAFMHAMLDTTGGPLALDLKLSIC